MNSYHEVDSFHNLSCLAIALVSQVNRQVQLFSAYAIIGIWNVSKVGSRKGFKLSSSHIGIVGLNYLYFDDNSTFLLEDTFESILVEGFATGMIHAYWW